MAVDAFSYQRVLMGRPTSVDSGVPSSSAGIRVRWPSAGRHGSAALTSTVALHLLVLAVTFESLAGQ